MFDFLKLTKISFVQKNGIGEHLFTVDAPDEMGVPTHTIIKVEGFSTEDALDKLMYNINSVNEGSNIHYYGCVTYHLGIDGILMGIALTLLADVIIRQFL